VVLFVASYAILTLLVVEQGRTIEAQRGLLRDMLKDSTQLAELKGKLARENRVQPAGNSAEKPAAKEQQNPAPNAAPAAPKASPEPQSRAKAPHSMKEVPTKPAEDLQDVRRSTNQT
jgi:hypothetical protein